MTVRSEWWRLKGGHARILGQLSPFQRGVTVGFLYPSAIDIRGRHILCAGPSQAASPAPTHSVPGAPPVITTTGVPRHGPGSPRGRVTL